MKIGLIDVDGHNFPNLALMKISAWHKSQGDTVEWCFPLDRYDIVYQSKVFDETYSLDIEWMPMADKIIMGGTGYYRKPKHKDYYEIFFDYEWINVGRNTEMKVATPSALYIYQYVLPFAWDNPNDDLVPYFERYKAIAKHKPSGHYGLVYVLVNFGSTMEENLHRIYTLRDLDYDPYVMIYDKQNAPREIKKLQRWCNNKFVFRSCERFEDYKKGGNT